MTRLFIDSSFFIALRHAGDGARHVRAQQIMRERLAELYPFALVTTDYLFDETVTFLRKHASAAIAIEEAQRLHGGEVHLEFVGQTLFEEALDVFTRYRDKQWSFTDCTSYVWIKRFKPDYVLSFDENFDQFGLSKNLATETP